MKSGIFMMKGLFNAVLCISISMIINNCLII